MSARHFLSGARRLCRRALLACAGAWLTAAATAAAAEPSTRQVPLPPGLASVWRVDGRMLDSRAAAWSTVAFSTDGKLVGVSDDRGTRVYRAGDGGLVRSFPAPFSMGQFTFSVAISSAGHVAVGRVGGIEVHALEELGEPLKFQCGGVCGPVSAIAFSPDGAWLAYQSVGGSLDSARGLVNVVDVRARARVVQLEASATRAGVMFAPDGRTLVAANTTRVDDVGTFGVVRFSRDAEWQRARGDVPGAQVPRGSVGPYAFTERAAAYARDGSVELRDLATGALLWAQPFVPPGLDSTADVAMKLDLVALSPRGELVLDFESPVSGDAPGALVLRRLQDGSVIAMYDVVGVSALAFAPDGETFAYSTGAGRTYTVVAQVPR